jgi:GntR family transcriptional regulator, rspAB operon transcriptional repressor
MNLKTDSPPSGSRLGPGGGEGFYWEVLFASAEALDPAAMAEIYLLREAIEPKLVTAATRRMGANKIAAVQAVNEESEACQELEDTAGYLRADRQFHELIFEASGLRRIQALVREIWDTAEPYRQAYAAIPNKLDISVVEHRMILDAIERGSGEDAGELHRIHIRHTRLGLGERN